MGHAFWALDVVLGLLSDSSLRCLESWLPRLGTE